MSSAAFALTYMGRAVVATSFFLSSGWKIAHPGEFQAAYRQIASRYLGFSVWVGRLLSTLEIAAGILILITGVPRLIAVLPSLVLLFVLSLALVFAHDLSTGCGCWTTPPESQPRRVYLVRNLIIAIFALTGLASVPEGKISFGLIALSLIVGGLISFTLMQLPEIRLVWLAGRRPDRGTMS